MRKVAFSVVPAFLSVVPAKAGTQVSNFVVPAKAGTQVFRQKNKTWIPAFAGMTALFAFAGATQEAFR